MFDIAMTLEGYLVDEYASEGIKDIGKAIGGAISKGFQKVKAWWTGLWGKITNYIKSLLSPSVRAIKKEDKIRNRAAVDFVQKVLPATTKTVEQGFAKLIGAKSNKQMLDRWGTIEPKVKNAVDSAKDAYSKVNTTMNANIFSPRTCAKLLTKIEANKSSIDKILSTAEQCIRETSASVPNKFKTGGKDPVHSEERAPSEGNDEVGGSIANRLVPMIASLQPLYSAAIRLLRPDEIIKSSGNGKNELAVRDEDDSDSSDTKRLSGSRAKALPAPDNRALPAPNNRALPAPSASSNSRRAKFGTKFARKMSGNFDSWMDEDESLDSWYF